ncbi:transposase domain-containing protein [Pseudomonas chlororaphis]|uniref:transposase domain-containing protein n=1 Tax=Pseudomonas chlororaphis TaxID=587753 RepID=UPI0023667479|nr:transposase domain-containing protein [Pseudomonas chlororaphis]WDH25950.1 transposase domain-containing protein [Pseudomonas chlororaphis]
MRLAEDIRSLVEQTTSLFLSLIKNLTSLLSFIVVLWQISGVLKFTLWDLPVTIYGYLVWVAIIYAALSSVIAHWIDRPLHRLNVEKQRVDADYRASLLQVRERAAAIMSLIQSARMNGHDPYAYLKDVIARLPMQRASEIARLLPYQWGIVNLSEMANSF